MGVDTEYMTSPHTPMLRRADIALGAVVAGLVLLLVWGTVFGGGMLDPVRAVLRAVPSSDKIAHFSIYGSITFFASLIARRPAWIARIVVAVFTIGLLDEIRQIGEFGRSYTVGDLVANGLGVAFGAALALLWVRGRIESRANGATPLMN